MWNLLFLVDYFVFYKITAGDNRNCISYNLRVVIKIHKLLITNVQLIHVEFDIVNYVHLLKVR